RGGDERLGLERTGWDLLPQNISALRIDGDDFAFRGDGHDAAVDEERRGGHSMREWELPQELAGRGVERVEVTRRVGVARNDDAVADEERLAVKLRGGAVV